MKNKDLDILNASIPQESTDDDYYINSQLIIKDSNMSSEQEDEDEEHPTLTLAKEMLDKGIAAASGMKKLLEQLYAKDGAVVKVKPHEKELKRAMKRFYGTASTEITFDMYKQALAARKKIAKKIRDQMIDEQSNSFSE